MRLAVVTLLGFVAACAEGQPPVTFVSNEQPNSQSGRASDLGIAAVHTHPNGGHSALPNDEEIVEPDHPAVDGKSERALVHIHTPNKGTCSGVLLAPSIVATAATCLAGEPKGASALAPGREYRVEVASTTLTWTVRTAKFAVVPDCEQDQLDAAILVLSEPVPWIDPPKVTSAPDSGTKIKALGFGRCGDQPKGIFKATRAGSVSNRDDAAVVIDVPLCRGDVGGPVVDNSGGDVIGLISHREDPEGSPLRTTTITRLDTKYARRLVDQSKDLAKNGETGAFKEIHCHMH